MKFGDLVEYVSDVNGYMINDTGIIVEVDCNQGKRLLLRVQWINAQKPEWMIYNKDIIKLIAQA